MKAYDVYSSTNGEEWYHHTTTTDPDFIDYLNSIDDVVYWKTVESLTIKDATKPQNIQIPLRKQPNE